MHSTTNIITQIHRKVHLGCFVSCQLLQFFSNRTLTCIHHHPINYQNKIKQYNNTNATYLLMLSHFTRVCFVALPN